MKALNQTVEWTRELLTRLEAMVADGTTFAEIGRQLGVSKNAAIGQATRRGFLRAADAVLTPAQAGKAAADAAKAKATSTPHRPASEFPPAGHCLWPHGDPGAVGFRFCAAPIAAPGVAYCGEHMARAYVRRRPPEELAAMEKAA